MSHVHHCPLTPPNNFSDNPLYDDSKGSLSPLQQTESTTDMPEEGGYMDVPTNGGDGEGGYMDMPGAGDDDDFGDGDEDNF